MGDLFSAASFIILFNPYGVCFQKAPKPFRARKAIAKSRTLRLHSCFIQKFLTWTEDLFIQEVLGVYSAPFLDTDELTRDLRARKVPGAFEKRPPGDFDSERGQVDWYLGDSQDTP